MSKHTELLVAGVLTSTIVTLVVGMLATLLYHSYDLLLAVMLVVLGVSLQ